MSSKRSLGAQLRETAENECAEPTIAEQPAPAETVSGSASSKQQGESAISPPEGQKSQNKPKNKKGEFDQFYLENVYPDPLSIFSFKPEKLADIKGKAIIVFDTSALLQPYNVSDNSLKAIDEVMTQLAGARRLKIPAQVAREFAKHRFDSIIETANYIEQKKSNLKQFQLDKRPLLDSLAGIDDLKKVIGEYNNAADRARELLTKMSDSLVENICSDPVSEIYRKLFDSEVVINTDETHARLVADSDNRNIHEIAPGF